MGWLGRAAWLAAAAVIVATACGQASPPRAAGPAPSPAASTTSEPPPTPQGPTPAPPVAPATPLAAAPLPCRLPIDKGGQGGFLDIPATTTPGIVDAGNLVIDPAGHPALPDGEEPAAVFYSWTLHSWLPVRREWVAADGTAYVYSDRQGAIHVATTAQRSDRVLNSSAVWAPLAFEPEGIYAAKIVGGNPIPSGLWQLDQASGEPRLVEPDGAWMYVEAGVAWGLAGATSPAAPPNPPPNGLPIGTPVGSRLVRLDLATRTVTDFYAPASGTFRWVGVDRTRSPIITPATGGPTPLLIVTALGRAISIGSGYWINSIPDGDRAWLAETYGPSIWLQDPAGTRPTVGPGAMQTRVAGICR